MLIRLANQSDSLDILQWRNNKISRKMSLNNNIITPDIHQSWFNKVLGDNSKILYIAELDNKKVGVCRFEFYKSKLVSEVSINLNPKFRGKGYGKRFLKSSILKYIENNKNDIIATVKSNNLASIRIFNYCGFKIIKNEGKKIIFMRKYQ